jgi:cytoskeletal protein CcmA (bactofilin family)
MFNKTPHKDGASLIKDLRQSLDTMLPVKQPVSTPRMSGSAPTRSVVDACLVITGNLQSDRDVQVDGEINGDVHCSQLVVSKDATINGNVTAEQVVVRGKVKGIIRADQVVLQETAHVESEIFHKSLIIEQGARFDGQSHRTNQAAKKSTWEGNDTPGESERAA